ncbi:DUF3618 domain-containing protein [Micromonospora sp. CPCC 206061]|uniref:DUF3618 domain-containing protein n=1 Tax=Micromonospora sp. CPCC 206061 TaxID=3122410 RepID=UPI002FEFDD65
MNGTNGSGDVEMLREDIRQARADLGETVQALAAKADVKARVRASAEHTRERALAQVHDAGVAVRRNAVPWAAMVAGATAAIIVLMVIQRRRG